MRFGIIGTGGRSLAYLDIIKAMPEHEITAICDADPDRLRDYRNANLSGLSGEDTYTDHIKMLADDKADIILICTPDTAHKDIALACAAAGKHMLLEKPVATTHADTAALLDGLGGYRNTVYLGFVLRFTAFYRKIYEIVRSGATGDIVTVSATEILDARHASSFYRRWHRFSVNNGGLMNAKCSHDLDLLSWIIGSEPVEASAFGGRRFFVPRNDAAMYCRDCRLKDTCAYVFNTKYYDENFGGFHSLSDLCVYNSEKDIVDHECMMIKFADGTVAQFELCMFGHEENRTITIHGTKAVLQGDFLRGEIILHPIGGRPSEISLEGSEGGHGGGDKNLIVDMTGNISRGVNVNHARAGCLATLTALAGEVSMREGRTVRIESEK